MLRQGRIVRLCGVMGSGFIELCSSRIGFSFLLPEQKKRNKENSPSAFFCLLRCFSPLNKKNSLRSNSFLFLTLRKTPALYGKKKRPDLDAFFRKRRLNIASLVGVYAFSLEGEKGCVRIHPLYTSKTNVNEYHTPLPLLRGETGHLNDRNKPPQTAKRI